MLSPSTLPESPALVLHAPAIPCWKRSLDIAGCIIALPVLLVVAALVTLLIATVSRGPIFFRQQRVGYMGRLFMLYKFRTMHVGAETESHRAHIATLLTTRRPMQKLDSARDARLIPGGWLLRASGLDELPQLINVLLGDMSLVGPRPCIPYEYDKYSLAQRARFASAPGLTGLWQVSGKNRTTFDEMIRLDLQYTATRSFWLDAKILFLTAPALCTQIADTVVSRRRRAPPVPPATTPRRPTATVQA